MVGEYLIRTGVTILESSVLITHLLCVLHELRTFHGHVCIKSIAYSQKIYLPVILYVFQTDLHFHHIVTPLYRINFFKNRIKPSPGHVGLP